MRRTYGSALKYSSPSAAADLYPTLDDPSSTLISREVTLLPRHWEWLANQSGGTSATLRKLIEDAKKKSSAHTSVKQVQERVYRFMSVIGGDMKGYEEALRALYRADREKFLWHIQDWPADVRTYVVDMAKPIFEAVRRFS